MPDSTAIRRCPQCAKALRMRAQGTDALVFEGLTYRPRLKCFMNKSAEEGCHLCITIVRGLASVGVDASTRRIDRLLTRAGHHSALSVIFPTLQSQDQPQLWEYYAQDGNDEWPELGQLEHIPDKPLGDASLAHLQTWLRLCDGSHSACQSTSTATNGLPKRVIDVGATCDVEEPRLYVSRGEVERYITLSYRWGGEDAYKTLTSNIKQRRQGMILSEMPRMFRDVIAVTRILGVRYLWIDAICIVQDDLDDWEAEAAQMAAVYGGAYLTISATSAPSPSAGLAPERDSPRIVQSPKEDRTIPAYMRRGTDHSFLKGYKKSNTTNLSTLQRGWCYQERYLSKRIVHYIDTEMVWECRTQFDCQCGGVTNIFRNQEEDSPLLNLIHKVQNDIVFSLYPPMNQYAATNAVINRWLTILQNYAETSLTYHSDLLPALSGIASELQGTRLGRYFGGLWELNLTFQLAWSSARDPAGSFGKRPSQYTAPSFSPLSRIGSMAKYSGISGSEFVATVIDIRCVPSGKETTGSLSSGYLKISGPLIKLTDPAHAEGEEYSNHNIIRSRCRSSSDEEEFWIYWIPDADESIAALAQAARFYLLQISGHEESLVLIPNRHDDNVHRVGFARNLGGTPWFIGASRETVTIV